MKRYFIIPFFLIVLASMTFKTKAQAIDFSQYNSWAAGIKFGLLPFYGDVRQQNYSTENKYKKTNTAFTFEVIKNFSHVFGARVNLMSGKLTGSSPNLNMHFTTNLLESSLSGIININDLVGIYPKKNKVINAYLFAGAGLASFRSGVYSFDEDSYITGFGYDSTGFLKTSKRNEFVFPLGIGFKFNADEKFDIGFEYTLHLTNTDKLDGWMVENSYNDRYSYAAISFTYKIGNRSEFVDWISPFQDTSLANIILARNKSNVPEEKTDVNVVLNNNQNITENNSGIVELKYFIISGTYTSKKLAKDATDRMISKGYPNANYFLQKSSGNWRVYYKGYATIDAALTDWVSLKKTNSYAKLLEKKEKESYSDITASYKNYTAVVNDTAKTQNKTNVMTNNTNTTNNNTVNNSNNTNTNNNTNINNSTNSNTNNTSNTNNNTNNTSTNNNSNTTSNTNTNNTTNNTNTNTTNTTTVIKKFFIIAGSFATEELAKEGVAELKAKGFIYAEVVGKNDYGSYRIAYKGYATREEANNDLPTIKQNTNPSAWIFEKK